MSSSPSTEIGVPDVSNQEVLAPVPVYSSRTFQNDPLCDDAFKKRKVLRDVAKGKVGKSGEDFSNGHCMLCLKENVTLIKSHITSNGLYKGFYGKAGQASYFEHHGKQVSSTNHFNYYLFCGTCEDRFGERNVVPVLKRWVGVLQSSTKEKENMEVESNLYHFVLALFMRQLSMYNWEANEFTVAIFKTSVEYVLAERGKAQKIDSLPSLLLLVTKSDQNLWNAPGFLNQSTRTNLARKILNRSPFPWMNYQARAESFAFDVVKKKLVYQIGTLWFGLQSSASPVGSRPYFFAAPWRTLPPNGLNRLRLEPQDLPIDLLRQIYSQFNSNTADCRGPDDLTAYGTKFKIDPSKFDHNALPTKWAKMDQEFFKSPRMRLAITLELLNRRRTG